MFTMYMGVIVGIKATCHHLLSRFTVLSTDKMVIAGCVFPAHFFKHAYCPMRMPQSS